jgi:hypothetical protein
MSKTYVCPDNMARSRHHRVRPTPLSEIEQTQLLTLANAMEGFARGRVSHRLLDHILAIKQSIVRAQRFKNRDARQDERAA